MNHSTKHIPITHPDDLIEGEQYSLLLGALWVHATYTGMESTASELWLRWRNMTDSRGKLFMSEHRLIWYPGIGIWSVE
jgi:hypothetical protein